MKIICPFCNRDTNVVKGDRIPVFCLHCRKLLPHRYCKKCNYGILHDDAKFCNQCGEKIETATV